MTNEKVRRIDVQDWEEKTEKRLKKYPDIMNRLELLEIELEKQAYPSMGGTTNYNEAGIFNLNGLGVVSDEEAEYRDKIFEKRILDKAIDGLKPDLKEVTASTYIDEKTITEICKELNISESTYNRRKKLSISYIADWLGMKHTYSDMTAS